MGKCNPCRQSDFLYFYSLQAGVVICASIGIFLCVTSVIVNLASENSEVELLRMLIHYVLVLPQCVISFFGFTTALFSAYHESMKLSRVSLALQSMTMVYWLVLLAVSFLDKPEYTRKVCIESRCPDHYWLQDARWRRYPNICDPADLLLPVATGKPGAQSQQGSETTEKPPDTKAGNLKASLKNISWPNLRSKSKASDLNANMTDMKKLNFLTKSKKLKEGGLSIFELLWLPQTGFGKTVLFFTSVSFSVFLLLFFGYSITTLASYKYEMEKLAELDDN